MKTFLAALVFVLMITQTWAQTSSYYNTKGIAINSYDPVSYFTEQKPVMGSKDFNYSWNGVTWYFKNAANRDAFKSNPEKFSPQFGGFCAYGVSENHKSPTDPAAFTIVEDKLYLNYNQDVKKLWLKDTAAYIQKARENWNELKTKKP